MDKTVHILKKPLTMTLIAIFFGFVVAGIILAAVGYPPVRSLGVLLNGVFSSPKHMSNVIIKSTPLILTGIGVAFAFKTGLFNIGAEGQFIMGCVAATVVGIVGHSDSACSFRWSCGGGGVWRNRRISEGKIRYP